MKRAWVALMSVLCVFVLCSCKTSKAGKSDKARPAGNTPAAVALDLGGGVTMKLALVPAGKFTMGSPTGERGREECEGPPHEVTISKPFYLGVCAVTQEQYEAVMGNNPSYTVDEQNAVERVTWEDAVEFCRKASGKTRRTVRLPTEAQWEYACRAGAGTRFCFGDDDAPLGDYAWHRDNSGGDPHRVAQKKPNRWGLYDMHGNVWEWCSDYYADSYAKAGHTDPQGPGSGTLRVLRGGFWGLYPDHCRSASRHMAKSDVRANFTGFRVVVEKE